ncbi:Oligopeptide transport ATP-binding protein OppF [Streptomyces sp. RB5]|uniref:Oligopeptide transport ATP-binding protein OppF n=1 Tax=Streptomyces smaragdinus TaxID=2585196 RepID=A0A7K0CR73_9ACTN|nr:ABC transporter ATP-binding protein [Streptomyces smaragdinus]MQY15833.1 Oligopeptide transport ATP-binding protein OppF [Streptomyces smaragdinus]
MTGEPLLSLKHVSQTFASKRGDLPAVRDVTLSVARGDVLCLVGESGCGKTTTARMAAGLAKPTAGTVEFEGADINRMDRERHRAYRKAVQFIHQDPYASLNPIRTVFATLSAPLRRHGLAKNRDEAWEQASDLLRRVELTPPANYLAKYPHQLSGGQRQRVAVARALALNPRLIIADEATSMLDVSIRVGVLRMLTRLREELDVGFVFITHDLAIARYFGAGGRIAVMYLGEVVEYGATADVIDDPRHPYTRALLSAVPDVDPGPEGRRDPGLRGVDIPSLTALPSGCTFHPRCPLFVPGTCDTAAPALRAVPGAGQEVACHVVAGKAGDPDAVGQPAGSGA